MSPAKIFIRFVASLAVAVACSAPVAALTVTQPATGVITAAGDDFATQVLGNAWDMSDAIDIDAEESSAVGSQVFSGGVFSGTTSANGAFVYPLFPGFPQTINLSRGANFPINTAKYHYLTIKLRATQPAGTIQFARAVFLQTGNSYNDGMYGLTPYTTLLASQWMIVTFDLNTQIDPTSPHHWTDFAQVSGLRIDPATTNAGGAYAPVQFDIDWIRLTATATAAQKTTVQWTDSGFAGTYNITAIDTAGTGTSYTLGTGVSGTSFSADTSVLAPGQYRIHVARSDNSASANSAIFAINSPPQIALTSPSAAGDQSRDFATLALGNPWGPIDATDFLSGGVRSFTNVSYSNPSGSFYGRPLNNDTGWFMNLGGQLIDANLYRSVCFSLEVFGPRNVGTGSVARLFWGNSTGALSTSMQIVLDDNANDTNVGQYCVADLAAIAPDPSVPANGGTWSGTKAVFRLDPDEFTPPGGCNTADTCHDVRLDRVTVSPFASANTGYTFTWSLSDADNASTTLTLALDPDTTPGNGNEHVIYNQAVGNGNGSFAWSGEPSVPSGTYHVLATVGDGLNSVNQYAAGLLVVTSDLIFLGNFQ